MVFPKEIFQRNCHLKIFCVHIQYLHLGHVHTGLVTIKLWAKSKTI